MAGKIMVGHPWMRPATGDTAAVGLSLLNQGSEPDRLIGATSPAAKRVVLVDLVDGKPAPVQAIELLPGKPIPLKPGARELRLEGLTAPLAPGGTLMLTLTFERAGSLPVEVMIETAPGK
jgi:copper(I)-binding protein